MFPVWKKNYQETGSIFGKEKQIADASVLRYIMSELETIIKSKKTMNFINEKRLLCRIFTATSAYL